MTKESIKSFITKRRIDIIVIASLLLLSIIALLVINLTKKDGAYVRVEINGEIAGEYPLDKDGSYTLPNGSNVLTIEGGKAYMSYSDCPGQDCVHSHKISNVGESIICTPNRIALIIIGESDDSVELESY